VSAVAEEIALGKSVAVGLRSVGQISIEPRGDEGFVLAHRDDAARNDLVCNSRPEDAATIARFDDAEKYRPLKTAPNLRHGWRLVLQSRAELRVTLDLFYPGRLAAFVAGENNELTTTSLRETLARQTGMYRVAAKISEEAADALVGNFCRSDGGCLRTILWRRDRLGTVASSRLPPEKFDPSYDQTGRGEAVLPLLCQEACNLLVAEARKVVKCAASVEPE
jgi:sirohydrochlorin cobaltochelatase